MGIKSVTAAVWNYTKSYFDSKSWNEAAQGHAIQAAPLIFNFNKYWAAINLGIVAGTVLTSKTAQNAINKPGEVAENLILNPINKWGDNIKNSLYLVPYSTPPQNNAPQTGQNNKISESTSSTKTSSKNATRIYATQEVMSKKYSQKETLTWKTTKAAGDFVTNIVDFVGSAITFGAFYAASNGATKIVTAAVTGRSVDSVKEAAVESWEDAKAIGHGFLALGDMIGYFACRTTIDPLYYVGKGTYNQTIGRIWGQDQDEVTVGGDTASDDVA